jgi:fatty-acyl-CoA synthase
MSDLSFDRSWSYQQLDNAVAKCATFLLERGVLAAERVACVSKNRAEQIILHYACARLGAIYVPINWRLSTTEIEQLLVDCSPQLVFVDDQGRKLGVDGDDIDSLLVESDARLASAYPVADPSVPSLMLYTSGTTGTPKGVLHSETTLAETAMNFSLLGEVSEQSVFLCESPMFHVIGLVTSIRPAFLRGASVVISDGFEPGRTLARLADPRLRVSHYFGVPQMAVMLRAEAGFDPDKLRHLKAIFTGGAPHPEAQIRDWVNDGLAIVDGYGSSEGGTVFGMSLDIDMIDKKAGCVGMGTPRIQTRIVDASGQEVAAGQSGELQFKGPNLTVGYWRAGAISSVLNDEGWFETGDIVSCDEEGYFRILDRKKDMFISGGENVYPAELESLLVKYPGIKEVSVVGVPDEKWGEVGCVFYVSANTIPIEDFSRHLSDSLARYKLPKLSVKVDALPRNGAGKVVKPELLKLVANKR